MSREYKPFDLDRALAGDKFARKHDLKEPIDWHYFKNIPDEKDYPLICVFDDIQSTILYTSLGHYVGGSKENDLIMLPVKKKLFIGIDTHKISHILLERHSSTIACESAAEVKALIMNDPNYQIIEIEIEV